MTEPMYYLFRQGLFVGKYTRPQWRELKADEIFNNHVYLPNSKCWYISMWGSLVPLNDSDIPKEIKALLLLIPIDQL